MCQPMYQGSFFEKGDLVRTSDVSLNELFALLVGLNVFKVARIITEDLNRSPKTANLSFHKCRPGGEMMQKQDWGWSRQGLEGFFGASTGLQGTRPRLSLYVRHGKGVGVGEE